MQNFNELLHHHSYKVKLKWYDLNSQQYQFVKNIISKVSNNIADKLPTDINKLYFSDKLRFKYLEVVMSESLVYFTAIDKIIVNVNGNRLEISFNDLYWVHSVNDILNANSFGILRLKSNIRTIGKDKRCSIQAVMAKIIDSK